MGGEITEFILFRAAVFDAVVTTLVITPFLYVVFLKKYNWLIIAILFFIAVYIEYYAIGTDRWAYDALMPIVPFLGTGLTPTVQLGFLGYLTFKITERV
jgi:uncharacterized membrane protein